MVPEKELNIPLTQSSLGCEFQDAVIDKGLKERLGVLDNQRGVVSIDHSNSPSSSPPGLLVSQDMFQSCKEKPSSDFLDLDFVANCPSSLDRPSSSGLSIKQKHPRSRKEIESRKTALISLETTKKEVSFNNKNFKTFIRKNQASEAKAAKCPKRFDNTVVPCEPSQYQ